MLFTHVIYKVYDSEKDITKAQKWLSALGSKIKVTGKMSIGMTTALCSFQRKNHLTPTGELNEETWNELKRQNSKWRKFWRK